jgi:protein TonB
MTRRLRIAAIVSVLLHLAVLGGGSVVLPRLAPVKEKPDREAQIELLMLEQKGAGQTSTGGAASAPSSPPQAPVQTEARPVKPEQAPLAKSPLEKSPLEKPPLAKPEQARPEDEAAPAKPQPARQPQPEAAPAQPDQARSPAAAPAARAPAAPVQAPDADLSPAAPSPSARAAEPPSAEPAEPAGQRPPEPSAAQVRATPSPPAAPLQFNLGGTESESNAIASGNNVIPASIDDRARNRPPVYPEDAARRGQQGAVVLLIHVSASGRAAGSDVLQTSGVPSLDSAAQQAVASWHFRPAMKAGQAVPFDMPMRFVFEFN